MLPMEGERPTNKAEAAAAWAEAKEALDEAQVAMSRAGEQFEVARKAEEAAWEALQAIAGRKAEAGWPAPESARAAEPVPAPAGQNSDEGRPRTWREQTVPIPPRVIG